MSTPTHKMSQSVRSTRIVTVTHEFYPTHGGIATYVQEVARAASDLGKTVEVWAPKARKLEQHNFPFSVKPLPVKGTQGWLDRIRLGLYVRQHQLDLQSSILFLPEPGPLRTWMYLQLLTGSKVRKLVISLYGSELHRLSKTFHRRALLQRLLDRADRIGVVSGYVGVLLSKNFPGLEHKTVIARGAVRLDMPLHNRINPTSVNEEDGATLLTVGRIHPRKGQLAVLEALGRLQYQKRRQIQYYLAGPVNHPAYLRKLKAFALTKGIRLHHLGAVSESELAKIYDEANIYVMTSVPFGSSIEGFGLSYLEASANGLPIIAHRIGGAEDAVKDQETGILVDPDDRRSLAHAIERLVDNRTLRKSMGEAGRRRAKTFSWKDTATKLFEGLG